MILFVIVLVLLLVLDLPPSSITSTLCDHDCD